MSMNVLTLRVNSKFQIPNSNYLVLGFWVLGFDRQVFVENTGVEPVTS